LPETRWPTDEHHPAVPGDRGLQHRAQRLALVGPADVRRGHGVGETRLRLVVVCRQRHEVEVPFGGDSLQRRRSLIDEFVAGRAEHAVHRLRRQDPAGRGQAFDALGDDHGLAVEIAVLVDHLTGVQPDAHLHRGVEAGAVELAHLHLHLASGAIARRADENAAIRPSPISLISAPRLDATAWRAISSTWRPIRRVASSPSAWLSCVDSTRSVNSTVTVPSGISCALTAPHRRVSPRVECRSHGREGRSGSAT
jgi:hypothetical protein